MISFILATFLAAASAHNTPAKAATIVPSPPADVWLDCKWHETWQSSSTFGGAHRDSTADHDFEKTYMFSPQSNVFSIYDSKDQILRVQHAVVGINTILVDDRYNDESILGEMKSIRQWTVSRSDLSVKIFGGSTTNTRMDDGRISTSQILMNGVGTCAIVDPLPVAKLAPNKF